MTNLEGVIGRVVGSPDLGLGGPGAEEGAFKISMVVVGLGKCSWGWGGTGKRRCTRLGTMSWFLGPGV